MTNIPNLDTPLEIIDKFPDANNYTSREVYSKDVYEFFQAMGRFTENEIAFKNEFNNVIDVINIVSTEIEGKESSVIQSATTATAKANEAEASATIATNKATEASSSADSASSSKNEAKTSETNAKASEILANKWANENKDVIVDDGKYSAKHYALKAEEYMNSSNAANSLTKQNNLSDLPDKATARTNLELGNVDNTSDLDKPISNATNYAIQEQANISLALLHAQTI